MIQVSKKLPDGRSREVVVRRDNVPRIAIVARGIMMGVSLGVAMGVSVIECLNWAFPKILLSKIFRSGPRRSRSSSN